VTSAAELKGIIRKALTEVEEEKKERLLWFRILPKTLRNYWCLINNSMRNHNSLFFLFFFNFSQCFTNDSFEWLVFLSDSAATRKVQSFDLQVPLVYIDDDTDDADDCDDDCEYCPCRLGVWQKIKDIYKRYLEIGTLNLSCGRWIRQKNKPCLLHCPISRLSSQSSLWN
jgi:hypothetical protein